MSSDSNRSAHLSTPALDHQRSDKTVTTIYFLHCGIDNILQTSLWTQYLRWLLCTFLKCILMISMISLQQIVIMLYCFLGFSPVVRQNPKYQVLIAGSHHAVPHVQWQSHHRSPCPATAVSSHCSLPLESANATMCGARCLKCLGILTKSFKEQKECYISKSLSSWL